jgi:hypothetical protein
LPCAQLAIVVEPVVPARTVAPPTTPTAVGTFVSLTLLSTSEPCRTPPLAALERMPIGVFVIVVSMIASPPTVCVSLVSPPVERSKPIWQLLMLMLAHG